MSKKRRAKTLKQYSREKGLVMIGTKVPIELQVRLLRMIADRFGREHKRYSVSDIIREGLEMILSLHKKADTHRTKDPTLMIRGCEQVLIGTHVPREFYLGLLQMIEERFERVHKRYSMSDIVREGLEMLLSLHAPTGAKTLK